ncbi:hypothetical protein HK104_002761 [Borealophlyctis nickersoniae]|nr:hypothetical protein HK104_002761 [Borealophlyctis nickersoniae]
MESDNARWPQDFIPFADFKQLYESSGIIPTDGGVMLFKMVRDRCGDVDALYAHDWTYHHRSFLEAVRYLRKCYPVEDSANRNRLNRISETLQKRKESFKQYYHQERMRTGFYELVAAESAMRGRGKGNLPDPDQENGPDREDQGNLDEVPETPDKACDPRNHAKGNLDEVPETPDKACNPRNHANNMFVLTFSLLKAANTHQSDMEDQASCNQNGGYETHDIEESLTTTAGLFDPSYITKTISMHADADWLQAARASNSLIWRRVIHLVPRRQCQERSAYDADQLFTPRELDQVEGVLDSILNGPDGDGSHTHLNDNARKVLDQLRGLSTPALMEFGENIAISGYRTSLADIFAVRGKDKEKSQSSSVIGLWVQRFFQFKESASPALLSDDISNLVKDPEVQWILEMLKISVKTMKQIRGRKNSERDLDVNYHRAAFGLFSFLNAHYGENESRASRDRRKEAAITHGVKGKELGAVHGAFLDWMFVDPELETDEAWGVEIFCAANAGANRGMTTKFVNDYKGLVSLLKDYQRSWLQRVLAARPRSERKLAQQALSQVPACGVIVNCWRYEALVLGYLGKSIWGSKSLWTAEAPVHESPLFPEKFWVFCTRMLQLKGLLERIHRDIKTLMDPMYELRGAGDVFGDFPQIELKEGERSAKKTQRPTDLTTVDDRRVKKQKI